MFTLENKKEVQISQYLETLMGSAGDEINVLFTKMIYTVIWNFYFKIGPHSANKIWFKLTQFKRKSSHFEDEDLIIITVF